MFIMHNCNMDVCYEVLKINYQNDRYYKFKVTPWNLGYTGNPFRIDPTYSMNIKIDKKEFNSNWKSIEHLIYNKRTKPGIPD